MKMNHLRSGSGKPLILIHGLLGSARSWFTIWSALAAHREVIAVDLPWFGDTSPLAGETSICSLSDAVTAFIDTQSLRGIDVVGSSMGARLVLELARRGGVVGSVVSLNPGGFWCGGERHAFYSSIWLSIRAARLFHPVMLAISQSKVARTTLLTQFSRRPWALDSEVVLEEMRSYARAPAFDELLHQLAYGEEQKGAAGGSIKAPLVIGWGRNDRVCFTNQATVTGDVSGCAAALIRKLRPLPALGRAAGDSAADSRQHRAPDLALSHCRAPCVEPDLGRRRKRPLRRPLAHGAWPTTSRPSTRRVNTRLRSAAGRLGTAARG